MSLISQVPLRLEEKLYQQKTGIKFQFNSQVWELINVSLYELMTRTLAAPRKLSVWLTGVRRLFARFWMSGLTKRWFPVLGQTALYWKREDFVRGTSTKSISRFLDKIILFNTHLNQNLKLKGEKNKNNYNNITKILVVKEKLRSLKILDKKYCL